MKAEAAVSYRRVSSQGQIEGDGLTRQQQAIEKYAASNGISIVDTFSDEGVPGKTELENRPGLAACLDRVENNGVKLVLVESADRLARDSLISEIIIRQFQKAGCRVVTASGGVDLTLGNDENPTAKLIRQILASVAEFDRCVVVLKLRAARERRRATGAKVEGRKPYGFRPEEQSVLGTIQAWQRAAYTPMAIAEMLNQRKIPPRSGQKWHPMTVSRILKRSA